MRKGYLLLETIVYILILSYISMITFNVDVRSVIGNLKTRETSTTATTSSKPLTDNADPNTQECSDKIKYYHKDLYLAAFNNSLAILLADSILKEYISSKGIIPCPKTSEPLVNGTRSCTGESGLTGGEFPIDELKIDAETANLLKDPWGCNIRYAIAKNVGNREISLNIRSSRADDIVILSGKKYEDTIINNSFESKRKVSTSPYVLAITHNAKYPDVLSPLKTNIRPIDCSSLPSFNSTNSDDRILRLKCGMPVRDDSQSTPRAVVMSNMYEPNVCLVSGCRMTTNENGESVAVDYDASPVLSILKWTNNFSPDVDF